MLCSKKSICYQLKEANSDSWLLSLFLCSVYNQGHKVFLCCKNEDESNMYVSVSLTFSLP